MQLRFIIIIPTGPKNSIAYNKDMESQARATYENLRRSLESVGATFDDVVVLNRVLTDLADQDVCNKVHAEYFPGDVKPTTTTFQVVKLATDPRCLLEINAIAIID